MELKKKEIIKNRIKKTLGLRKGAILDLPSLSYEQGVEPSLYAYMAFVRRSLKLLKVSDRFPLYIHRMV